jgi:hypothetical protein
VPIRGFEFFERNIALLPFIHSHVAAMPDAHVGIGATVGSVIATRGAIIPAAVGVDIGCGQRLISSRRIALSLVASSKLAHVPGNEFLGNHGEGIGLALRLRAPLSRFLPCRVNNNPSRYRARLPVRLPWPRQAA